MPSTRNPWLAATVLALGGLLGAAGCYNTPLDTSEFAQGPAPRRMPSPAAEGESCCYEDSLTGGQIFTMYCSYCHNAPSLAERPYAQFRNVAAHMRVRANLTGKEYAKLVVWLRRWHDVPPAHPPLEPARPRLIYSQPMSELQPKTPPEEAAPKPAPAPEPAPKPKPEQPAAQLPQLQ